MCLKQNIWSSFKLCSSVNFLIWFNSIIIHPVAQRQATSLIILSHLLLKLNLSTGIISSISKLYPEPDLSLPFSCYGRQDSVTVHGWVLAVWEESFPPGSHYGALAHFTYGFASPWTSESSISSQQGDWKCNLAVFLRNKENGIICQTVFS